MDELNPAQGRILFVLWQEDGIPIQTLARETSLGKSTLTHMLDRLENSGYIRRKPSHDDRRQILIYRTEKDRAFQEKYIEVSRAMTGIWYDGFDDKEIDRFESMLERIFGNLTKQSD
ncbi:MarR family transcriptional regulator [bacterium]|nr:MarR family transcriptional regulator [bacterium]